MSGGLGGGVGSGGMPVSFGGSTGGAPSGGSFASGGNTNGGAPTSGGVMNPAGSGGESVGGAATGGAAAGGSATGGATASGGGPPTSAVFTDDFESSSLDSEWVMRINGNGSFSLDDGHKHGGNKALRTSPSNGYSTLLAVEGAPVFPAPNNTFYARVWFWLPASTFQAVKPGSGGPHVIWLEAGTVDNDKQELRIGMNLGYLQSNLWPGDIDLRDPTAVLKSETWHCLEVKMGNDDLEVWLDDKRSDAISTKTWVSVDPANGGLSSPKSNWSPTYEAFRIGFELNAGTNEIYYDDVALGYSRIGCGL